ncbi:hypothetical protein ASE63_25285 [Bosea sp. Root381]|uniref:hypothetical protein n=1 Tax=Bosea sp. Root381 TaxID=1736524 RepID=UPI0007137AE2|nr:hypothetical protein [Bosea sp. Root381]KRE04927.1 hypothetical protein ASE63_25285 [Bosea sp. Root381]
MRHPSTTSSAVPATVLGADQDGRELDGFLARLFDAPQLIEAPDPQEGGVAEVGDSVDAEGLAPAGQDAFMPELGGAIETVTIGFAGISYADAVDVQDGPSGSHANLLHGLF